jgi:hypothetical protein
MQKWEYSVGISKITPHNMVCVWNGTEFSEHSVMCNYAGLHGWELVSVLVVLDNVEYYFKRPK